MIFPRFCFGFLLMCLLGACCGPSSYQYQYVPGRTAVLRQGKAVAPADAPHTVHKAIAAANRIAGLPYRRGGGHYRHHDSAYDCSGAASYVLREAGLMQGTLTSSGFRSFGKSGEGKWITVFARKGHVYLVIAGLRFDTGYRDRDGVGREHGPRWSTRPRPLKGAVARHPAGY